MVRYTPLTHTEAEHFLQEMVRTRKRGCAINLGEWRTEVRDSAGRLSLPLSGAPRMARPEPDETGEDMR